MGKRNSVLTGVAGEYYVAAELSKRGLIASITLRNTAGVDILCRDGRSNKGIGIQVKTASGKAKKWLLNKKCEKHSAKDLFYIFVSLKGSDEAPDFYIVPSRSVANYCAKSHKEWLSTPGKNKHVRRDTDLRQFRDPKQKYKGKWDLLGFKL